MTRDTDGEWAREDPRASARHGRAPRDYDTPRESGPYGPPDPHAAPGGYGPPPSYDQPGPYGPPAGYGEPAGYGPPQGYAAPGPYDAPGRYAAEPDRYAAPGPYGTADPGPYAPSDASGQYAAAQPGRASQPGRRRRPDSYEQTQPPPARPSQPGRRRRTDSYPQQDPDAQTDPSYRPGSPPQAGGYYELPHGGGSQTSALGRPERDPQGGRPRPADRDGYGQAPYPAGGFHGGQDGYPEPDRGGYGPPPGRGDELAGRQRGGYGPPARGDERTLPPPSGYAGGGGRDDDLAGRPGAYRGPGGTGPHGSPQEPGDDGRGAYRWQPGPGAADPDNLGALPPRPDPRTAPPQRPARPENPGYPPAGDPPPARPARPAPSGRTGPGSRTAPPGQDWGGPAPGQRQRDSTAAFTAGPRRDGTRRDGTRRDGPHRDQGGDDWDAEDSGVGLPGARDAAGRGPWPQEADDEDDWDDEPGSGLIPGFGGQDSGGRPRRRMGRRLAPILAPILALILFAALGVGGYRLYQSFQSKDYTGSGFGKITVEVEPGDTATSLAPRLVKLGVVASVSSFVSAAKTSSSPSGLEPGFFAMRKHMNSAIAYKLLLTPSARIQSVVSIPEGLRANQILATLAKDTSIPLSQFTAAAKDTAALGLPSYADGKLEGYLYPATYTFDPGTSPAAMLKTMVARFNQEAASINLPAAAKTAQLNENQVITVASILEAEAGNPKYYAKVAEVIYNRLNTSMFLGLDSTVNYALNRFGVSLTTTQLHVDSPYNTFIHKGLPPGPIDSPGNAAIEAALHPARGDLTYFVTVNLKTGLTLFTNSPSQFQQFEEECDRNNAC